MPPYQWQSRFLHDLTSILSGVNIFLYLPANVGELFQKSGFFGEEFFIFESIAKCYICRNMKKKMAAIFMFAAFHVKNYSFYPRLAINT